ncbi:hypothetical protein GW17_00057827, partial [Ensete ventricosum]
GMSSSVTDSHPKSWYGWFTHPLRAVSCSKTWATLVKPPLTNGRSHILVFEIQMERMTKIKRLPLKRYLHDGSLQRISTNLILQLLQREGGE